MVDYKIVTLCFLLLLGNTLAAQQLSAIAYRCDTSSTIFHNSVEKGVSQIVDSKPSNYFHLFEGEHGYGSPYSFVYWNGMGRTFNRIYIPSQSKEKKYEKKDIHFYSSLHLDSLLSLAEKISTIQIDTNYSVSHDHLLTLDFFIGGNRRKVRFCESQLLAFVANNKDNYLYNVIAFLRRKIDTRQY